MAAERETAAEARRKEEVTRKPLFTIKNDGIHSEIGKVGSTYHLVITNAGAIVSNVVAEFDDSVVGNRKVLDVPIFNRSEQKRAKLLTTDHFPLFGAHLCVRYTDVVGREDQCTYRVTRISDDDPTSILKFLPVEASQETHQN